MVMMLLFPVINNADGVVVAMVLLVDDDGVLLCFWLQLKAFIGACGRWLRFIHFHRPLGRADIRKSHLNYN